MQSVEPEPQSAEASMKDARLTYVAQAQGDNLILQHSQSVGAPVHDVQLGQDTCTTKCHTQICMDANSSRDCKTWSMIGILSHTIVAAALAPRQRKASIQRLCEDSAA